MESAVLDLFHAVDALDWDRVGAALDDRIAIDYTSLFGGEASTVTREELLLTWQGLLPGFDATQHLLGPLRIEGRGTEARAECHVRGYHHLEGSVWMVAGHYRIDLRKRGESWRVSGIRLDIFYQEGETDLVARAQERALAFPRISGRARTSH